MAFNISPAKDAQPTHLLSWLLYGLRLDTPRQRQGQRLNCRQTALIEMQSRALQMGQRCRQHRHGFCQRLALRQWDKTRM